MYENSVGVSCLPELDRLAGPDGHNIDPCIELALEAGKDRVEQA